ncbi:unnamed protein product [Ambrosiozyma monospora]|uniref:Unnamed protein product n=1 Tax=Ambrosiozyma monospora TaxID=43982 RepID=A0ACB5TAY4_AMBMO|nr:unnamed protein product [Ambrosiozyma monospora]
MTREVYTLDDESHPDKWKQVAYLSLAHVLFTQMKSKECVEKQKLALNDQFAKNKSLDPSKMPKVSRKMVASQAVLTSPGAVVPLVFKKIAKPADVPETKIPKPENPFADKRRSGETESSKKKPKFSANSGIQAQPELLAQTT